MKAPLVLAAALLAGPVAAQEQEADPEPPAIVVEDDRSQSEKALVDLAREMAGNPRDLRPLARFEQPLCLMVASADAELGRGVAERVIENARAAKVRVRASGCKPNVLLAFSDDAQAQLRDIRKSGRRLFAGLDASKIDAALGARDPVYVFQTSAKQAASGQPILATPEQSPRNNPAPVNLVFSMGRLKRETREEMLAALVVIDHAAVAGLSPVQIADYASLRLLAPTGEVDVGEAGTPRTIMTLFAAPENAPPAMTRFDRAYLKALYRMPPGAFAKEVLRAAVVDTQAGSDDEG